MILNILNGKFNLCRGSQVWSKAQDLKMRSLGCDAQEFMRDLVG